MGNETNNRSVMSVGKIAKAGGANDGLVQYINEQELIQKALS